MNRRAWRDTGVVALVALALRAATVVWAHRRFPPIADGIYYDMFARRLAHGLGYTVAWPDGAVTYAAHYPVGYPAMLALAYRVFGASTGVAMGLNAAIGAVASACAHRVALRGGGRWLALAAALAVALHPALVLYTPAVMTEGVAAGLVVCAMAALPKNVQFARIALAGAIFGLATLVRPQVIVLAPLLAWVFAGRSRRPACGGSVDRRARHWIAAGVLASAFVTVAPWTARNCVRMHRCALVSVNGGWNLLIGVRTETGGWAPLEAPDACKTVWDEAQKDACFERAARAEIAAHPWTWLKKMPDKLAMTFDVVAAGPWYLRHANADAFGDRAALAWGAVETMALRVLLALAFVSGAPLYRLRVSKKNWAVTAPRFALAALGVALSFAHHAWLAYALLAIACFIRGRGERASPVRVATGVVLAATLLTHAVFFGAGRYAILVVPEVALAAFACVRPKALSASLSSASGR